MRVVSVSFFGTPAKAARYWPYLPLVIRSHHNLYPGWQYRIYHDAHIDSHPYGKVLRRMAERGLIDLVGLVERRLFIEKAMLWRLLPLWDERVELFLIRDVDMIASYRERCAVETWIRSGLAMHAISDKKGDHDWVTLNGMLGFRVDQTKKLLQVGQGADSFEGLLARAGWSDEVWGSNFRAHGNENADVRHRVSSMTTNNQFFLAQHMWPSLREHACAHRLSGSMVAAPDAKVVHTATEHVPAHELGISSAMVATDALTPFIGASHVHSPPLDVNKALMFFKRHGDRQIEAQIAECES